jgi:hypothetical protein
MHYVYTEFVGFHFLFHGAVGGKMNCDVCRSGSPINISIESLCISVEKNVQKLIATFVSCVGLN